MYNKIILFSGRGPTWEKGNVTNGIPHKRLATNFFIGAF